MTRHIFVSQASQRMTYNSLAYLLEDREEVSRLYAPIQSQGNETAKTSSNIGNSISQDMTPTALKSISNKRDGSSPDAISLYYKRYGRNYKPFGARA